MSKIKLYTSPWCPDCYAVKRVLDEKELEYEEINIDKNPEAKEIVIKAIGKRVVPTLEYKGNFIDGNHFEHEKFLQDLSQLIG